MGVQIGLVGLGAFGSAFADLFKAHPLVDRIALCDREPERMRVFAEKPSWRDKFKPRDCYNSLEEICKTDLDALVIITQPWLHAAQCIQAMEAGLHVYSAVPVVCVPDPNEILDWCNRLVETCRRTGRFYMLGETTYYHPQAMYCRRRAREGAFGTFISGEGDYFHGYNDPKCDLRQVRAMRRASRAGEEWEAKIEEYLRNGIKGGPMHYPTHSVSGPLSVMQAHATKVSCWGQPPVTKDLYFQKEAQAFSNQTALYHLSNGATMRICEYRECSLTRETFRIYGTKGSFENDRWLDYQGDATPTIQEMRDPLPREVAAAFQAIKPGKDFYGGHGGSHAYLVHEFVSALAETRDPAINAWEAVRYMAAGAVAHQSALRDGELLPVPDWGDSPAE